MKRPFRKVFAFLVIALALLLMTACGQSASTAHTRPTTTVTTRSGLQLVWHSSAAPDGALTVAPGDGDIAYACAVHGGTHITIWVTHDRGSHWIHAGDIPVAAGATFCHITIDGLQPDTLMVVVNWAKLGASPPIDSYTNYVTFDGGKTWRSLPQSEPHPYLVFQFSTLAGVTYAYLRVANGQQETPMLATSSDQMRTWHPILQGAMDLGGFGNTAFWLNPTNGALLVEDMDVFWSSVDAGAHWTKIAVPGLGAPTENVVVQAPVAGQPWQLCAANNDTLDLKNPKPNTLICSTDGGQTWQNRPAINLSFTNIKGTFVTPMDVFALASDGAVLATSSGSGCPRTTSGDYRLAANSQQWQCFNLAPGSSAPLHYFPAPGGGVLWGSTNAGLITASYP